MSYRQLSVQVVLYNVYAWIEFHKLLIVEFLPFVHEVSSLTYCQEGHLGILGYFRGNVVVIYELFEVQLMPCNIRKLCCIKCCRKAACGIFFLMQSSIPPAMETSEC